MKRFSITLLTAATLAACAGPEPRRLNAPEAAASAVPATFGGLAVAGASAAELAWGQAFRSARLQRLIPLALANNRDLRIAALNIESARAVAAAREADLWPTVNAGITGSRQPTASGGSTRLYTAGLQVSAYELDLFGRLRGLDAVAAAQLLAAQANQDAVRLALIASVANAELALQTDAALLRLTQDTLASRERSLGLVRQRLERGVANRADLSSAESAREAARVALAQTTRQRALDENALALLLGQPLPDDLPALTTDFEPLPELAAGLPAEVLTHRPDIRQAEQLMLAADANIDAARAAFLPRITLTGSVGTASGQLSDLFKNSAWSFAPQLLQPIFDAGRNRANLAQARAARGIALAQYEKAIQIGFREVADGLAARASLTEQLQAQQALVEAEARRLALAEQRLGTGLAGGLEVLDAQRALFAAQQALVQVQSLRAQTGVALYRALGGGVAAR